MKGRSYLTTLIFYGKATHLVDEGKAMDVIYLDFSKAFDIFPKPSCAHGSDGHILHWIKKLAGWLGRESSGEWHYIQPVTSSPGLSIWASSV